MEFHRTALIIADSRGKGMQQHLDKHLPGESTKILSHSGAGYELAAIKSLKEIRDHKPDIVIIMAGICDITWRDRHSKKTSLRYKNVRDNIDNAMGAAKAALDILGAAGEHKISFATVTGLNLTDYNNKARRHMLAEEYGQYALTKVDHIQQKDLDEVIIEVNRQLTAMNRDNGVPTTWTSTTVHSYYRKVHHHNYKKLMDGCHPNNETRERWAKQLAKSIMRIRANKGPKTE